MTKVSSEQVANTDLVGWTLKAFKILECAYRLQIIWPNGDINLTEPFAYPATNKLSPLFNVYNDVTGISAGG